MTMFDLDKVSGCLEKRFDEFSVIMFTNHDEQIRFSNGSRDLHNIWEESVLNVFVARGKRTIMTTIKEGSDLEKSIEELSKRLDQAPENPLFYGINDRRQNYAISDSSDMALDADDLADQAINGAVDAGSERMAGLVYAMRSRVEIATRYNRGNYNSLGVEAVVRSFKNDRSGQACGHSGIGGKLDAYAIGRRSAEGIRNVEKHEGREGRYDVILAPMAAGNILTSGSYAFSAHTVISGLSYLKDMIGKQVASPIVSIYDDPTDTMGMAYRFFDEEGTATKRVPIIDRGSLKTYLHSTSTARYMNTETTGNAGIISPEAWQIEMSAGDRTLDEMISDMHEGLMIMNSWYLRFQDYRNGVFSTVPRDGVYYIRNGEIKEYWDGIRISDSMPSILKNISALSRESEYVRWWNEIFPSRFPYMIVSGLNVTKSY
ncbi:TldD/PmbA family protein [Thermoplasma sp. Kam2015]|uniref:TldD/PmbA family protein n=1 Tax=Thermoplasma sp. Kam2015 TaxID=2094122 RepID=UPI000D84AD5F|nr:TldD/PmbA family protein [Thermoplasma sp. Kam2015]PYB68331.1 TldD/PmbA family protein [Thermoplasma sp. Kam2015]